MQLIRSSVLVALVHMGRGNKGKRKYEKKIVVRLVEEKNKNFLIEQLKQEWQEIERRKKRKELLDKTKEAGAILGKTLLALLLVGGVVTIAAVAPNVFVAFGRSRRQRYFFNKKRLNEEIAYLQRRKYIKTKKEKRGLLKDVSLTESGEQKIIQNIFSEFKILKPEKWDGVWRIVTFDIPNRHKWARDGFRHRLETMGFYRLQESVFIFPYPCFKEISFCASIFNVGNYIYFIETKHFYNDSELRRHFSLIG